GQPWPGPIYICDERFGETRLAADKQGNACHVPARDTWLDRQGETAFKHVVYASARADEEGVQEIATYTRILHRSRSANLRRSAGVALFFGCLLCAWLIAWRWRQEEPT
ncbi:MAG: hypothetical protein N3A66_07220, partial [Planctomycetota bacterium]|nr:hypothetical protein [Planctomycetota bacterium]